MALFETTTQNPLGLNPGAAEKVRLYARGGNISKGQVCKIDLAASDAAVTAATSFGGATNPTSNALATTETGYQTIAVNFYCVAAEDVSDDAEGWFYIRGFVQALGGDTSAAGTGLIPGTGSELIAQTDNSPRCIAVAAETMADATLKYVFFDGIYGWPSTEDVAA